MDKTQIKVGDILRVDAKIGGRTNALVTKITDNGYQYIVWEPTWDAYRQGRHTAINNGASEYMGKFTLPIAGNEYLFSMSKPQTKRWTTKVPLYDQPQVVREGDDDYNCYRDDWDTGR